MDTIANCVFLAPSFPEIHVQAIVRLQQDHYYITCYLGSFLTCCLGNRLHCLFTLHETSYFQYSGAPPEENCWIKDTAHQNNESKFLIGQAEYLQACEHPGYCLVMESSMLFHGFECGLLPPTSTWRYSRDWCPFFASLPLPCIVLNANWRTKAGEAWEHGLGKGYFVYLFIRIMLVNLITTIPSLHMWRRHKVKFGGSGRWNQVCM